MPCKNCTCKDDLEDEDTEEIETEIDEARVIGTCSLCGGSVKTDDSGPPWCVECGAIMDNFYGPIIPMIRPRLEFIPQDSPYVHKGKAKPSGVMGFLKQTEEEEDGQSVPQGFSRRC